MTFFLLVHPLKTSCNFCLWQLQAVHAPALSHCQSVLSGLCKKLNREGLLTPRIIVKTSFTSSHGSAKSMPLPLARRWHNLYTHNLKLHSSWLSYQMGSLRQTKTIVFPLILHHRFLLVFYSATKLGEKATECSPLVYWKHTFAIKFSAFSHLAFKRHVTPKCSFFLVRTLHFRRLSVTHWLQGLTPHYPSGLLNWADAQSERESKESPRC